MSEFVHLHNHTHYSLLDGACKIDDLIDQCVEQKMNAIAMTDHGNMFGAIEFYKRATEKNVKPIIGVEIYIAPESRFTKSVSKNSDEDTSYHLILLSKDYDGYRNLMKLVSAGYLEGFYYKPRIDKELLRQYHHGLIALSACLKGEIPRMLLRENFDRAEKAIEEYLDIFGDDFYLELQDHKIPEEKIVLNRIVEINSKYHVPYVATNDIHYIKQTHMEAHDILVCLQTGKDFDDPNRMRMTTDQLYFKSAAEMAELFSDFPEAISNTVKIAEKCHIELDLKTPHLPGYSIPDEYGDISLDEYLQLMAEQGLRKKLPEADEATLERLHYELDIIKEMKYTGYFLIVKDFIDYAKNQGIPVGPGRGSAAGSLVSYSLGITNVNPLHYTLLFERFLNPERVSMPDIDIDFCYERREEVIKYVRDKYGEDNVTQIITFGTMAARAVIRDVGRVLKIPYGEVDKIAKMIPSTAGMTIDKALEQVAELRELTAKEETYKKLIEVSKILEGLARHASTHAAGVIITPEVLTNFTPLFRSSQGDVTTEYDMTSLEDIGVLKMDFLGLRTLTVIQHTLKSLSQKGIEIDIDKLPLNDQKTYDIFVNGETVGVFQFESPPMREYLKKLKPRKLEDLVAMNALYRPGPMNYIDDFIQRKHGLKEFDYPHPALEPLLRETYGIIVYQEQVMQIASALAGFSMGKADILRWAMGKKKVELMAEQRKLFLEGTDGNNVPRKLAEDIFDLIEKFAGYGFNKSHAVSYSLVAYQTAYLKAYYPVEFMAASLTSEMGDTKRVVILIEECKRMGIEILPPDVNESIVEFMPNGDSIRFGMGAIKNVGRGAIRSIICARNEEGPFRSIFDLCSRIDLRLVNKKVLESLVQAGALDSIDENRAQLLESIDIATMYSQKLGASRSLGQTSIFESNNEEMDSVLPKVPEVATWNDAEILAREKEMLGFYLSGHPLSKFEKEIKMFSNTTLEEVSSFKDGMTVKFGGMIINVKKHYDRKNKPMAFITIEDFTGTIEAILFSSVFERYANQIENDKMLFFIGKVSIKDIEDAAKVLIDEVVELPDVWEKCSKNLCLVFKTDVVNDPDIRSVGEILTHYKGECGVLINIVTPDDGEYVLRSRRIKTKANPELIRKLKHELGEKNVWIES
ncbi:DNA polymerase III subunit alpha [candidate division KSB1 bacterium]|nr:DNA polymerase III subunit alpha [candidate division KSB1 bacterium]